MRLKVDIKKAGPFLSGQFEKTMPGVIEQINQAGADYALKEVSRIADQDFQHPTGRYQSHLQITSNDLGLQVDDDGMGVLYGAWLEGVASRNKRSRFKGYFLWRRAAQKVRINTIAIANKAVAEFVKAMNGK